MNDVSLGFIVSTLPWWLAAPLVQLAVLVVGMALDETYVNRTTVLTAAIATHIHIFVAGEAGVLVSVYADAGLAVGAYGLYAYVVDGYVGTWFRLLAYYVYSPLSAVLVILTAGPTVVGVEPLFVPALAAAGYANYRFREYLRPEQPFYFGPRTREEFEAVLETEAIDGSATDGDAADVESGATGSATASATADTGAGADGGNGSESERGAARTAANERGANAAAGGQTTAERGRTGTGTTDGSAAAQSDTNDGDDGSAFDRPGAEPAAAESTERGILPKFMRRL